MYNSIIVMALSNNGIMLDISLRIDLELKGVGNSLSTASPCCVFWYAYRFRFAHFTRILGYADFRKCSSIAKVVERSWNPSTALTVRGCPGSFLHDISLKGI